MAKVDDTANTTRFGKVRKFDVKFKGIIKNRSCTDTVCLGLFLAFLAGWGFIAHYGYAYGMLERIIHPTDSQGQICGYQDAINRPFLLYFDLTKCAGPEVLIAGCTLTKSDVQELVAFGSCAAYYFPSGPVAGRCLPGFSEEPDGKTQTVFDGIDTSVTVDNSKITFNDVLNGSTWINLYVQTQQTLQRIAVDFQSSWKSILVGFVASAVLSLIWVIIIGWVAGPMLWVSILAMICGLIWGVYYCYHAYAQLSIYLVTHPELVTSKDEFNWKDPNNYPTNPTFWLIIGLICIAALIILVLIVLFMRTRIGTAVALIRVSSRAISHMLSTLFFPLFPLTCQLIVVGACASCSVWLAATGAVEGIVLNSSDTIVGLRENDKCDPNNFKTTSPSATGRCQFVEFTQYPYLIAFQLYNALGFLWGIAFSIALGQIILSGAFASYYWAWVKPKDVPAFPLLASLYRTFRYHLGSVAFGSLLVALVQLVQYILLYVQKHLKKHNNAVTQFLIKVVIVDSVVAFFLFFGKILILGILGCFFYYFYELSIPGLEKYAPHLNFIYVPLATIVIGSYIISSMFFGVYVMAIDTMFLCFLEDLERNDGTEEKPYFMSKSLMQIYRKKNKIPPKAGADG
ncbi:Choline transporter-like protein 2 [Hypsibius exemplaris]|uniref:Choline transporter-like protein n=1 Tax=Hypsibius exemplaris TaxID=2072580 RepID=A0A1W0WUB4_HYPEX|nr:Choline transporter-like protein 2 [Hypsibius exemplaris]